MTRVAFFKWKDTREVIAVLDTSPMTGGLLDSYMHIGQHGPVSIEALKEDCELIDEKEKPIDIYGDLFEELKSIGYEDLVRDNKWVLQYLN